MFPIDPRLADNDDNDDNDDFYRAQHSNDDDSDDPDYVSDVSDLDPALSEQHHALDPAEVVLEEEEFGRLVAAQTHVQVSTDNSTSTINNDNSSSAAAASHRTASHANEWDRTIEEDFDVAEMDEQLGIITPTSQRRPKKTRRARVDLDPSPQVKEMLGRANQAYVEQNLDEAIVLLTEIVRIEPTIRSTWFTLATISTEMGNIDKSIQFKIVGAHLTPDAGDLWKDLAAQSRARGLLQQAIYCYSQAIKSNKADVDAIWDRAILYQETGKLSQAASGLNALLRVYPQSLAIVRTLAPLLSVMGQAREAFDLLNDAISYWKLPSSNNQPSSSSSHDIQNLSNTIDVSDIVILADLSLIRQDYAATISLIKSNVRWLLNRDNNSGNIINNNNNNNNDDSEFDPDPSFRAKNITTSTPSTHFQDILPRPLRVRLGIARLKSGNQNEALLHFNIIRSTHSSSTSPSSSSDIYTEEDLQVWGQMADTLYDAKLYSQALEYFSDIANDERINAVLIWMKMAQCLKLIGRTQESHDLLVQILQHDPQNHTAKIRLAEILEELGQRTEALKLLNEIIEARRNEQQQLQTSSTTAAPAPAPGETDDLLEGTAAGVEEPSSTVSQSFFSETAGGAGGGTTPGTSTAVRRSTLGKTPSSASRKSTTMAPSSSTATGTTTTAPLLSIQDREELERRKEEEYTLAFTKIDLLEPTTILRKIDHKNMDEDKQEQEQSEKDIMDATKQWLEIASFLVEGFRMTPPLFPVDSKTEYRGVIIRKRRKRKDVPDDNENENENENDENLDRANHLANRIENSLSYTASSHSSTKGGSLNYFRGRDFDVWTTLMVKYSFVLTKLGEASEALDTLRHVSQANVMKQNPKRTRTLRLARLAIMLHTRDFASLSLEMRKFILGKYKFDFPLRVFQCLFFPAEFRAIFTYTNHQMQKFILRQLRAAGGTTSSLAIKNTSSSSSQQQPKTTKSDAEDDDGQDININNNNNTTNNNGTIASSSSPSSATEAQVRRMSSMLLAMYGNMLLASKSYQSSFLYLLRAYELKPNDPLISLSLSVSYFQRAMQRQSDNRHHQIAQALGFLATYRKNRQDPIEVEYNFGRAFHQIGVKYLAIKHYENTLRLADEFLLSVKVSTSDSIANEIDNNTTSSLSLKASDILSLAKYAAYNLHLIYFTLNQPKLAQSIIAKWLLRPN